MKQKITFDTPTRNAIAAKFGVSQQAITNWLARDSIPAEKCPDIEQLTGIRCEDLRPDINWDVLRQKVSRTLIVYPKSKKSIRANAHVEKHMGKSA